MDRDNRFASDPRPNGKGTRHQKLSPDDLAFIDMAAEQYANLLIEVYEVRKAERALQRKNKITPPEK